MNKIDQGWSTLSGSHHHNQRFEKRTHPHSESHGYGHLVANPTVATVLL